MLEIKNISKFFNGKKIISKLSFSLHESEKICLFAPSGSGKSTLINILNGFDRDFSGSYCFKTNEIATILQKPDLFWYKTVKENILYSIKMKRIEFTQELKLLYDKWIYMCDLKEFENFYPHEISGGMKQKVSIIRSFLINQRIMLMDEPFNSIDLKAKKKIINFINQEYSNLTILFITHNIDEIPLLADKVLFFPRNTLSAYEVMNCSLEQKEIIVEKILKKMY